MVEDDYRSLFNKWVSKQKGFDNFYFEHKFVNTTRKKRLHSIRDFKSHQLDTLYQIEHYGYVYTISNQSFGKKPFDSMKIKGNACVTVMFWKPRQTPHVCYVIRIDDFFRMIEETGEVSFLEGTIAKYGDKHTLDNV